MQRVFWWTLVLRYLLAVVLNVYAGGSAFGGMFWGDSGTYDAGGYGLALVWQGDAVGAPSFTESVGRFGFYYFVGAIYFVFGRNQLLVQFLNGTIGALTVLVMHALAMHLFGAARCEASGDSDGVLPRHAVLVRGHVQGSGDSSLHRRVDVRGGPAARSGVCGDADAVRRGSPGSHDAALLHRLLRGLRDTHHLRFLAARLTSSADLLVWSPRRRLGRGPHRRRTAGGPGAAKHLHDAGTSSNDENRPGNAGTVRVWP